MAPAEISKVVGAPVLTVRTRLFYARRELEAMLADEPSLKGVLHELNGTSDASNGSKVSEASETNEAKAPTERRSDAGVKRKVNPTGSEAEG